MIFRIVLTSLFTMLMITPLQTDWKKATISNEGYAGKGPWIVRMKKTVKSR